MIFAFRLTEALALGALGLFVVLGLALGIYFAFGLFQARSLLRREISAYFLSPIAYVLFVVLFLVMGYLFSQTVEMLTTIGPEGVEWPMQKLLGHESVLFWVVYLFTAPLLTMRLFAEEKGTGTLEALMTAPLRDWQIVLCKYLSCLCFYVLLWAPTVVYLPLLTHMEQPVWKAIWSPSSILMLVGLGLTLLNLFLLWFRFGSVSRLMNLLGLAVGIIFAIGGWWGHRRFDADLLLRIDTNIDPMPVITTYVGLFFAGALFLSLGMLVSSLVRSQIVAAILALLLSLPFIAAGFSTSQPDTGSMVNRIIYFFSVPWHFSRDFTRGVLDTRHLTLYVSVTLACIFMTVRSLESQRWR